MAKNKLYTGVSLEDDVIKIARISISGNQATLEQVDRVKLVSALKKSETETEVEEIFDGFGDLEDDSIFGIEDTDDDELEFDIESDDGENDDLDLDLDFDDLEDDDILDVDDMAEEANEELASSNELLIYNVLNDIDSSHVKMSLNIPAGATIFQILKDIDFSSIKKKDLQIIIDDRLESLYGAPKSKDNYSSTIRDDGSLLLVSIDENPQVLNLIHAAENLYSGKITINEILPDEALVIGLFRANYEVDNDTITALIQYTDDSCRVIFLKGKDLLIVSPIITEGSNSPKFLNTLFSKILFQLDTGEVPNLDSIIFCNNSLGEQSISFFQDRFPDIAVSDFQFDDDVFSHGGIEPSTVSTFTSAIALAWADAGFSKEHFPDINFVPGYIKERQKIFKLQWHGFLLLALILAVFPVTNYFYQSNSAELTTLREEVSIKRGEISGLEAIVQDYNRINNDLSGIQSRLVLLDELSQSTLTWTVNLDLINQGIDDIGSIWLTSVAESNDGTFSISGISLYRNRIPMIADLFSEATLVDVTRTLIREREAFNFTYQVSEIVPDPVIYTPESAKGLNEVLGGQ